MIQSKKINIIVAIAVVFALITSIALVVIGNIRNGNGGMKIDAEYADKIFGTDIISIEIIADEAEWQEMLDNATKEQFIMVDVIVNGTKFQNVGIRPKGNSSLNQVASSGSDRYSFRLQFDEYIKGQTCFGLDSFVINNMISDNTYMKEYVSYELMKEIGVDAPYFGFADIKVNGKGWGLYLAVETYGDSYEARTFATTGGMMYNVKSMDIGGNRDGNGFNFPQGNMRPPDGMGGGFPQNGMQPPANRQGGQTQSNRRNEQAQPNMRGGQMPPNMQGGQVPPNMQDRQMLPNMQGGQAPPNMQGRMGRPNGNFGGFMGGRGSNGGSLEYSNDEISSYSAIFNNVVGKGSEADFKRVINALKALSKGENLEKYFDVDKILRYLAAHTIVVNLDSYSSNMAQNYYLYENNGKVTILPWDYNLAWGGFQFGNAISIINFPIDTPVSGVDMSSRPLIEKLFSNTEYLEKYHGYLQELMTNYFANGKWEEKIDKLDALISDYVKNDKTAFCTFEEYKTAVETFKTVGNLRYQSIQGQLDGTVPSTTADQNANPDKLISAGDINLSLLGTMMGGNRGGMGGPPNWGNQQNDENFNPNWMGNMPDPGLMMQAMQIMQEAGGNITDEVKSKLLELGLTEEQISMFSQMGRGFPQWPGGNMQNTMGNNGRMPDRGNTSPFRGNTASSINTTQTLLIYSGLFVFVLISTFFVAKKKRNY
ncbi:MAG TPA: CotH kinase family protein [Pseudobacteroides sp.]|nr:CotH kinase family protein [Pseudobacteroides sp.]